MGLFFIKYANKKTENIKFPPILYTIIAYFLKNFIFFVTNRLFIYYNAIIMRILYGI